MGQNIVDNFFVLKTHVGLDNMTLVENSWDDLIAHYLLRLASNYISIVKFADGPLSFLS